MAERTFARARSAEQRAARRAMILATAAEMLSDGGRVAELSLNELARRVGLAKSNVLRYFETREAVLLALLDSQYTAWLDDVEARLAAAISSGTRTAEGQGGVALLADLVSLTAAERPVLAELVANAATVLEHNVSAEVAADYKHRAIRQATRLVRLVEGVIGELPQPSRIAVAGGVNLVVGGAWGLCRPSPGMVAAYEKYPELQAMRIDYRITVRELVATLLTGLLVRPVSSNP